MSGFGPSVMTGPLPNKHVSNTRQPEVGYRFPIVGGSLGVVRGTAAVRPVHAIEALALGPSDPVDHGAETHTEATRDGTKGQMLTNGSYHLATPLGGTVCLLMKSSSGDSFSATVDLHCSECTGREPFGMLWQLSSHMLTKTVCSCQMRSHFQTHTYRFRSVE
jgi:hypothetical protein